MTPEQTLDWLAEQHKSQCNEDRPVQAWIRSMKLMLPAPVQEPVAWPALIADEREACARLCEARAEEEVGMAYEGIALDCAAAIRARRNP
jgi:hypothetical protein